MNFNPQTTLELINAINTANTNSGSHTITLRSGGIYSIAAANNTMDGSNGLPSITNSNTITIIGNGATICRDSGSDFRIFHVSAGGHLTLQGLAILNGNITGSGGGFYNKGTLIIKQCKIKGNDAGTGVTFGGAIENRPSGSLTVSNSIFDGNRAGTGGAIHNESGSITSDQYLYNQ